MYRFDPYSRRLSSDGCPRAPLHCYQFLQGSFVRGNVVESGTRIEKGDSHVDKEADGVCDGRVVEEGGQTRAVAE